MMALGSTALGLLLVTIATCVRAENIQHLAGPVPSEASLNSIKNNNNYYHPPAHPNPNPNPNQHHHHHHLDQQEINGLEYEVGPFHVQANDNYELKCPYEDVIHLKQNYKRKLNSSFINKAKRELFSQLNVTWLMSTQTGYTRIHRVSGEFMTGLNGNLSDQHIITFEKVGDSDNGQYVCLLTWPENKPNITQYFNLPKRIRFKLSVIYPLPDIRPIITDGPPDDMIKVRGENVTFRCNSPETMTTQTVFWFKSCTDTAIDAPCMLEFLESYAAADKFGGQRLLPYAIEEYLYERKLNLVNVSDKDAGYYGCIVTNKRGFDKRLSRLQLFDVERPRQPIHIEQQQQQQLSTTLVNYSLINNHEIVNNSNRVHHLTSNNNNNHQQQHHNQYHLRNAHYGKTKASNFSSNSPYSSSSYYATVNRISIGANQLNSLDNNNSQQHDLANLLASQEQITSKQFFVSITILGFSIIIAIGFILTCKSRYNQATEREKNFTHLQKALPYKMIADSNVNNTLDTKTKDPFSISGSGQFMPATTQLHHQQQNQQPLNNHSMMGLQQQQQHQQLHQNISHHLSAAARQHHSQQFQTFTGGYNLNNDHQSNLDSICGQLHQNSGHVLAQSIDASVFSKAINPSISSTNSSIQTDEASSGNHSDTCRSTYQHTSNSTSTTVPMYDHPTRSGFLQQQIQAKLDINTCVNNPLYGFVTDDRSPRLVDLRKPPRIVYSRENINLDKRLGEGQFGEVWRYYVLDKETKMKRYVAVKKLKSMDENSQRNKHELLNEIEMMKLVNDHPNVVKLLNSLNECEPILLVMEYAQMGSLQQYLRKCRSYRSKNFVDLEYCDTNTSLSITSGQLIKFAHDVAKGMAHVTSRGIIHCDLASRNIVLDKDLVCKVADFGFAKQLNETSPYHRCTGSNPMPVKWMSPEALIGDKFTAKSDVYSFGVLLWEIVTLGATPYGNLDSNAVYRKVKDGGRLERPDHCKEELFEVMKKCWLADPEQRPTFNELVSEIGSMLPDKYDYIELDRYTEQQYYNIREIDEREIVEKPEIVTI